MSTSEKVNVEQVIYVLVVPCLFFCLLGVGGTNNSRSKEALAVNRPIPLKWALENVFHFTNPFEGQNFGKDWDFMPPLRVGLLASLESSWNPGVTTLTRELVCHGKGNQNFLIS